jgi:hypothetical protein
MEKSSQSKKRKSEGIDGGDPSITFDVESKAKRPPTQRIVDFIPVTHEIGKVADADAQRLELPASDPVQVQGRNKSAPIARSA